MAACKCAHISKIIYIGMDAERPPKLSKIQKIINFFLNNKKWKRSTRIAYHYTTFFGSKLPIAYILVNEVARSYIYV
jgi:hypothetical protein